MTDALAADVADVKGTGYDPVEFRGESYAIAHKPNQLLLSELSRTQSGDPEAMGTLADFFESTMGRDTYRVFRRAVYTADVDVEAAELYGLMTEIMEHTLGRPTE